MRVRIRWADETLHLLPDHALWWPANGVLFIADLHLGKGATFRALGQPVPGGTTRENLLRLSALIARHRPAHLVFLGDFLHGPQAQKPGTMLAVQAWRDNHRALPMTLVRGNHDSRAGDPPASLAITVVGEPHLIGPFACCHEPQTHPTHFVLAGHVHPVCRILGAGRDGLRLPCFALEQRCATLPAFGEFTGGFVIPAAPGRRLFGVGGGRVWPLPAGAAGAAG